MRPDYVDKDRSAARARGGMEAAWRRALTFTAYGGYATDMRTADLITEKLTKAFDPQDLRVVDESHLHAGHAGHRLEGETHYRVYIVSAAFQGKTRLERHRLVNAALAAELVERIHALAIHPSAPGEGAN